MKKYVSVLSILFAFTLTAGAQSIQPTASFNELSHDFGEIAEDGGKVSHEFVVRNIGSKPLVINNVIASCGCTSPTWTREPILPGESGFVKAVFDPRNRPGNFSKTITVYSNDETKRKILRIVGYVKKRDKTIEEKYPYNMEKLRLNYININMLTLTTNEKRTKEIKVYNSGESDLKLDFKDMPATLSVVANPQVLGAKQEGTLVITYDASKKNDFDYVRDWFYLKLNGKNDYNNRIMVSAKIVEDFSALSANEKANAPVASYSDLTFNFGTIKEGEKVTHEFPISNTGKSNLIIRKIKTSCGCTAAMPSKMIIAPGESTVIKATFNSRGKVGNNYKPITVITNSPSKPSQVLAVKGTVVK